MVANFFNQSRRIRMSTRKVLRKLKKIYGYALKNKEWHVALRAVEQEAHYIGGVRQPPKRRDVFEKQTLPSLPLPKIKRIADMTEEQLKDFTTTLEKMYPDLKDLDAPLEEAPSNVKHSETMRLKDMTGEQFRDLLNGLEDREGDEDPDLKKLEGPPSAPL
jgi:hypothetical protein